MDNLDVTDEPLYFTVFNAFRTLAAGHSPPSPRFSVKQFTPLLQAYNLPSRYYHAREHANQLAQNALDPELLKHLPSSSLATVHRAQAILSLAAVYHDIIQIPIDATIDRSSTPPSITNPYPPGLPLTLGKVEERKHEERKKLGTKLTRPKGIDQKDYEVALHVFGFKDGEFVYAGMDWGLNEFYSALLAIHDLRQMGKGENVEKDIVQLVSILEMTRPFRHQSHVATLEQRLKEVNEKFFLGLSNSDVKETMLLAVNFANRDVASFRKQEFGNFVDDTMHLAPEHTPSVRQNVTTQDYPESLAGPIKLYSFLASEDGKELKQRLFHHYRGYPSTEVKTYWDTKALENIQNGILYLKAKYVSAKLYAAIATQIGEPDVILDEFVEGSKALLKTQAQSEHSVAKALHGKGRSYIRGFDVPHSPAAAVIFDAAGNEPEKIDALYNAINDNPATADKTRADEIIKLVKGTIGDIAFQRITQHLAVNAEALHRRSQIEISAGDPTERSHAERLREEAGYANRGSKLDQLTRGRNEWSTQSAKKDTSHR